MADTIMTLDEVATRLRVCRETVRRMTHDGRLAGAFRIGGRWRYPASAIDLFLRQPEGGEGRD